MSKDGLNRWTYIKESDNSDLVRIDELSCSVCRVEHWSPGTCASLHPLDYSLKRSLAWKHTNTNK